MTPVSPVFVLGVELAMYVVYCLVSLATLAAAALLWGMRLRGSLPGFLGSWALTMLSTLSVGLLVGGVFPLTQGITMMKHAFLGIGPGSVLPPDLRHVRPDRPLHPPLPPLLPLGITKTPPPDLPAGVPCVYPRKFQKDFSKKLLRGEGSAEDAARRIQSRASLYMTEQYG